MENENLSWMLEKYVDRMNAHDVKGISDLWTEDGIFDDVSAKLLVGKPGYKVGKKAIKGTFRLMFLAKPKANILKMYDNGLDMDYDIHILGKTLPCHGEIIEVKNGKWAKYACTPREE